MSVYSYEPLSCQNNIRLLRLLPAIQSIQDEVRGELVEYEVHSCDDRAHPYEALSYCWGTEAKPKLLMVHDEVQAITQNLHDALVQLRYRDFARLLWVDAICINQSDDREKESQIPMMGEIFAKAKSVLVWLGPATDHSTELLDSLRSAGDGELDWTDSLEKEAKRLLRRSLFERFWASGFRLQCRIIWLTSQGHSGTGCSQAHNCSMRELRNRCLNLQRIS